MLKVWYLSLRVSVLRVKQIQGCSSLSGHSSMMTMMTAGIDTGSIDICGRVGFKVVTFSLESVYHE